MPKQSQNAVKLTKNILFFLSSAAIVSLSGCHAFGEYSSTINSSISINRNSEQIIVSINRNGQAETFTSFAQLCSSRALYTDIKVTIDAILKVMGMPDCNQANTLIPSITEIDLSNTQVASLEPLVWFVNLEKLNLSNTQVKSFIHLSGLHHLSYLDVSNTKIDSFIHVPSNSDLQHLDVSNTQISSFIHLPSDSNLQYLDVSNTKIDGFIHLPSLTNLRYLNVRNTRIDNLTHMPSLPRLERLKQGSDSAPSQVMNK